MPAKSTAKPPPVGGWDTENALSDMPEENAVILDNWFPKTDKVELRFGHASYATGMSGVVDSLMPYVSPGGTEKIFAANGSSIYDASSSGSVPSASVGSLSSVRFQSTQLGNAGGHFLFAVNGADAPQVFDGSSWAASTLTGSGLTPSNIAWCNVHQRRLWFGETNSLDAWYLGVNAITGTASVFPLGLPATEGGYLMAMGTWTRDAGDGADDVAVFVTSEGQAIVYQGTDPSSSTTWALVGVFRIGKPIGRRCIIKAGADLILVTQDGLYPVSALLQTDRAQAQRVAISSQINTAVNDAVKAGSSLFGWEPFLYPKATMLILNVPQTSSTAHQYVFNTVMQKPAACRFKGMNARCWALLGDAAYFGGNDGKVYKFDPTYYSDDGSNIVGDALQAFSYFGSPSMTKAFKRAEPIFQSNGDPFAAVELNTDFRVKQPTANPSASPTTSAKWGISKWGSGKWGTSNQVYRGWRATPGQGRAAALRVRIDTTTVRPSWVATNYLFLPGGGI